MTDESFSSTYERWILGRRRSRAIEAELSRSYRDAWRNGNEHDRSVALDFIFEKQDSSGFDIVIEAVDSDAGGLTEHAAIIAATLINKGTMQLTPRVRRAFANFNQRFPHHAFRQFG